MVDFGGISILNCIFFFHNKNVIETICKIYNRYYFSEICCVKFFFIKLARKKNHFIYKKKRRKKGRVWCTNFFLIVTMIKYEKNNENKENFVLSGLSVSFLFVYCTVNHGFVQFSNTTLAICIPKKLFSRSFYKTKDGPSVHLKDID